MRGKLRYGNVDTWLEDLIKNGCKEFYRVEYNQILSLKVKHFGRMYPLPSSVSKSKPSKKPAWSNQQIVHDFLF
jgi:hypothetical protein